MPATLLALLLTSVHVAAAAEISVVGSLVREAALDPGERTEGVILVRNNDDIPREIVVHQSDYLFHADGRNDFAPAGSLSRSNADWVSFNPAQVMVPPHETVPVYYAIQAPDQALSGSYWSLLLVEALPLPTPDELPQLGRGVQIQTVVRYGVELISDLGGEADGLLAFESVALRREDGRTLLALDVANKGELQARPRVWIDLFGADGASAGRVTADQDSRLLPGCSTRFLLDLSTLPPASYTGLAIADAGGDMVFGADYQLDLRP
ncbi:hypothetical protein L6R53_00670 [Myxococcota bacterium]|nr:hypothetical protein [Myxococcota bacterium]